MSKPPIHLQTQPRSDLWAALTRVGTIFVLGVLPVAALVTMFAVGVLRCPLSGDFHHELYPETEASPPPARTRFRRPDFDPLVPSNLIWPPLAAFLVSPLTILPAGAADIVIVLIGLACFALALWLVGVRDWRVYGVVGLWPEVVSEMRVSHLTPVIVALLVAAAWREQGHARPTRAPGRSGVAVKFFVWPLGAVARGGTTHPRGTPRGVVAGGVAPPRAAVYGLDGYVHRLLELGTSVRPGQLHPLRPPRAVGRARGVARGVTLAVGAVILAGDVALPELHARHRRRARALADRLAGLLRAGRAPPCARSTQTFLRSGSCRSRRGALRARGWGSVT